MLSISRMSRRPSLSIIWLQMSLYRHLNSAKGGRGEFSQMRTFLARIFLKAKSLKILIKLFWSQTKIKNRSSNKCSKNNKDTWQLLPNNASKKMWLWAHAIVNSNWFLTGALMLLRLNSSRYARVQTPLSVPL